MLFSSILSANSCVVLLYHHFSDSTPKSTSISPALFAQHLQYLQDNDFKVLKLKTMLERLDNDDLPNKCVVLTADDAYQSMVKSAYPLLKKYQMPMSVFVSSEPVDKKYPAMMTWQQMRSMQGDLVQFYNHTMTHPYLLDLNKTQIKTQITQTQNRLNQELNQHNKIFAYPYGEASLEIFKQVKDLGYSAFGQYSGVVSKMSHRQNLPRFPMAGDYAKMLSFKTKVNALPMPIKLKNINPIFTQNPPTLELEFFESLNKHQKANLNCFANGGVNMTWQGDKSVKIVAKKPLTERRSKYNCTMPSQQKSSYYWYSIQWINPEIKK
ncbi:Polysaccharide deacetylase [uncultured Gammaproteobacteria bacterium]|jgi:peptidoglycan/xylan/chitin deacetylase (PgdA/CDA1 family)|nr:Polysaccharide deacetylase [uncultured Gammaproteobacteria bacterium]